MFSQARFFHMSFLAPLGLLALLALPLIVILHMLRERRRRVVVPSLLHWQQLPQRQTARRRRRPPLSLLLLLHLLAAALLALALAQPQWQLALFGGEGHTVVVIDTSTSMAAPAAGFAGTRLDAARERTRSLLNGMDAQETLTLIATSPHPQLIESVGPASTARLLPALDALRAAGTGSDFEGALTLAETVLQGRPGARIVLLSDAALPQSQLDRLAARPAAVPIEWFNLGNALENRALISFAARPRGTATPTQVYARVANYGEQPVRTLLRLFGDDRLLDTRPVTLGPRGELELTWSVPRGVTLLRAELDGNDVLPADDTALLSLAQARPLQALLVSAQPAALERALRALPGLDLRTLDPAAYPSSPAAATADLTIFEGYLPPAWPAGGVLVINPPPGSPLLLAGAALLSQGELHVSPGGTALFDGLSLESVDFGPLRELEPPAWATPLLLRGEQPLILRGRSETSELAVWAFDLGQGNLTTRLAFPLLTARTVRELTPPALPGAVLLGESIPLRPDPRTSQIEIGAPDGSVSVLRPHSDEALRLSLDQPGLYRIVEQAAGRTLFSGQLAVNAGAAVESDLRPRVLPAPASVATTSGMSEADLARPIWPWLAALALLVMLIEWTYVHGRRRTPTEVGR
jgi:Ca-activated chloride channel homolog